MNIGYRLARLQGCMNRSIYRAFLDLKMRRQIYSGQLIFADIYSLSSSNDLPEQVVSIRTFIKYQGLPKRFIVISDGSHSAKERALLRAISSCIEIINWHDFINPDLPSCVHRFASCHPLGKKLAVLISLPINEPTIYTDSDVLFFSTNKSINVLLTTPDDKPKYLADCNPALDSRLIYQEEETLDPVNSGYLLFKKQMDWRLAIERLKRLNDSPEFHTEQTLVHLVMHANGAIPFCSEKFIISLKDQCIFRDLYAKNDIVLRHYVRPVRHKFWQCVDPITI